MTQFPNLMRGSSRPTTKEKGAYMSTVCVGWFGSGKVAVADLRYCVLASETCVGLYMKLGGDGGEYGVV